MKLHRCAILIAGTLLLCGCALADPWKFILTGDDRSGKNRPEDYNGVNTLILGELSKAIVAENPKLVLWSGDLIVGPKTDEEMESQLHTWLEIMDPVYKAGIKVYPIRGNHEMHVPHPDAVWNKLFTGAYSVPDNGPDGEKGLSYTASYDNALFIGVDEFKNGGDSSTVNQAWIDQVLKAKTQPHVFVFSHKMAFRSGHHDDGLETDPTTRDAFVKGLIQAGARVGFFGHDHLYDHRAFTAPGATADQAFHQFVVGTAGAPLVRGTDDPGNNSDWKVEKLKHIEGQYGYAVVEVDGPKVTITFKARTAPGVYEPADVFSYVLSASTRGH